jgi:hypothetical protein
MTVTPKPRSAPAPRKTPPPEPPREIIDGHRAGNAVRLCTDTRYAPVRPIIDQAKNPLSRSYNGSVAGGTCVFVERSAPDCLQLAVTSPGRSRDERMTFQTDRGQLPSIGEPAIDRRLDDELDAIAASPIASISLVFVDPTAIEAIGDTPELWTRLAALAKRLDCVVALIDDHPDTPFVLLPIDTLRPKRITRAAGLPPDDVPEAVVPTHTVVKTVLPEVTQGHLT